MDHRHTKLVCFGLVVLGMEPGAWSMHKCTAAEPRHQTQEVALLLFGPSLGVLSLRGQAFSEALDLPNSTYKTICLGPCLEQKG